MDGSCGLLRTRLVRGAERAGSAVGGLGGAGRAVTLWPLVNEATANRAFANMDELDLVVGRRVEQLEAQPDVVRGHTHWHWWSGARCALPVATR